MIRVKATGPRLEPPASWIVIKELERLKAQLKGRRRKKLERQRKAAEEKAKMEAARQERDRTRTRWPDPKVEMQKIRLQGT